MRMTFDFLDELLNAENFCFFHNSMRQAWHTEVNVYFFELSELLSTHGSPRSCLICVYVFVFVFVFVYKFNRQLWMDFGPSTGLPVLVEFLVPSRPNKTSFSVSWVNGCSPTGLSVLDNWVFDLGCLCYFQRLLNPIISSNYLSMRSLAEVEVTKILSRKKILQIPSQPLSGYNKLGVFRGE